MALIDDLAPGSELAGKTLTRLKEMIELSRRRMTSLYPRWQANERRMQAYISLTDYEKVLKDMADAGQPPAAINLVIPYSYATLMTIVTYLFQVFCGRKPIFQIGTRNASMAQAAKNMEQKLQYDSDHCRLQKHIWQTLLDGELYGVGILRATWTEVSRMQTTRVPRGNEPLLDGRLLRDRRTLTGRELKTVYEGNDIEAIDPYMFYPDPRVPMSDVNRKGEFVFWKSFVGRHYLKKEEAAGNFFYVDQISGKMPREEVNNDSVRTLISGGDTLSVDDDVTGRESMMGRFVCLHQGTVEVVPSDWGFGPETTPQKYIFTIGNLGTIIGAELFDADHDMHPVAVGEAGTIGKAFGQPCDADMVAPLQDMMGFLVNSHIANVRQVINNNLVVDPSMVEMQDLRVKSAGRLIRLKRTAYGQDVRQAIQQLQVVDVTRGHMTDLGMFMKIADSVTGVNDNLRGLQDTGGRKTATEVRTSSESGASRLVAKARLLSSMQFTDLTEIMTLNNMQYLSEDFEFMVTGEKPIRVEQLIGDYYFPSSDGSLPLDKVALLDTWQEILQVVLRDQQLRSSYDVAAMFDWIAELGGAQNIESFKVVPDTQVEQGIKSGALIGVGQLPPAAPATGPAGVDTAPPPPFGNASIGARQSLIRNF